MISATSSTTKLGDKRSYVKVAQAVWFINLVVPTCANYKLSYASNKFAQLDQASQAWMRPNLYFMLTNGQKALCRDVVCFARVL